MIKYTKKPVTIEAVQWDGTMEGAAAIIHWAVEHGGTIRFHEAQAGVEDSDGKSCPPSDAFLSIDTLEGTMIAVAGDWIIMGVEGEFYPCKPVIFLKTYSLARAPQPAGL